VKFPSSALYALVCTALGAAVPALAHDADRHHGDHKFAIEVLSSKPYLVSGGDALVRVTVKDSKVSLGSVRVELNGNNVTGSFRADAGARTLTGLVSGMRNGENELSVDADGKGKGRADADITLTNYPIQGPMISGPQEYPFVCTTANFDVIRGAQVPAGGTPIGPVLGAPLDANCSVARRVTYVYRKTNNQFAVLPQPFSTLPADVQMTTTVNGVTVPFIVRLESGTIDRSIYQTAVLHNPNDGEPSPFSPPRAWNGRLIYPLGGGCIAGWYTQGPDLVTALNATWLGKGHAVASGSLNTFGNNCNDLLSSEVIMMVKERFIENYGVPKFTIGTGSSGGSYQSNQTSDNYPGLFDGIVTMNSFPDVTTGMVPMHSSRLFELYLASRPGRYTVDQVKAMTGYLSINPDLFVTGELHEMSRVRGDRMDPRVAFQDGVDPGTRPQDRYDPATNPFGARGDVYDHTINVYGVIPNTPVHGVAKFSQRPMDNVGVQYGLKAFNDGKITFNQLLDINRLVGGHDINGNIVNERTVADLEALRIAYETGRINDGAHGLATIPIIDMRPYTEGPGGNVHDTFNGVIAGNRINAAGGGNRISRVYEANVPIFKAQDDNLDILDTWLAAVARDRAPGSQREKVLRNKPTGLTDSCFTAKFEETKDPATCAAMFPVYANPRIVAGGPVNGDVFKCELKPVDKADYTRPVTDAQLAQLRNVFPQGVCDYTKKGVMQRPVSGVWLTYPSSSAATTR